MFYTIDDLYKVLQSAQPKVTGSLLPGLKDLRDCVGAIVSLPKHINPGAPAILVFVDLNPSANWGHACLWGFFQRGVGIQWVLRDLPPDDDIDLVDLSSKGEPRQH